MHYTNYSEFRVENRASAHTHEQITINANLANSAGRDDIGNRVIEFGFKHTIRP